MCIEYESMIQAITCSSVPISGAMMSTCGPMNGIISCVNRRVSRSTSRGAIRCGSHAMPPFAPP